MLKPGGSKTAAQADRQTMRIISDRLEAAFGVRFELWCRSCSWFCVADESVHPNASLAAALEASHVGATEPRVVPLRDERPTLFVPFQLGHVLVVATTQPPSNYPVDLLLRTAQLATTSIQEKRELIRLQVDCDSLVKQVSEDFEELAFLRQIANLVEVSDLSLCLVRMADLFFPLLNATVKAESLFFVSANADATLSQDPRDRTSLSLGPTKLRDDVAIELVLKGQRQSEGVSVVNNSCSLAEVRNYMLTSVCGIDSILGWILAVNRHPPTELERGTETSGSGEFGTVEASILSTFASILGAHGRNHGLLQEKEELLINMVRVMVSAIEAKDAYTCGHSERVALYAARLAEALGLEVTARERIYLSGLLHDIGKIGVPDSVLSKDASLTEQEYAAIQRHPDQGWRILYDLEQLRYVLPGILYHHERFDGKGYPDGLAGEQIPLDGRILAVADTFDAMTSDRPYRQRLDDNAVKEKLQQGAGKQWDPLVVEALLRAFPDLQRIRATYQRPRQSQRAPGQWDAVLNTASAHQELGHIEPTMR